MLLRELEFPSVMISRTVFPVLPQELIYTGLLVARNEL